MLTRSNQKNLIILYEDNHLIIVNKRAGDIVQGDKTGDTPLSEIVKKYIKIKYDKPGEVYLGTAHRLDRPTSGIVIFSKTSKALSRLNSMLLERKIKKIYDFHFTTISGYNLNKNKLSINRINVEAHWTKYQFLFALGKIDNLRWKRKRKQVDFLMTS